MLHWTGPGIGTRAWPRTGHLIDEWVGSRLQAKKYEHTAEDVVYVLDTTSLAVWHCFLACQKKPYWIRQKSCRTRHAACQKKIKKKYRHCSVQFHVNCVFAMTKPFVGYVWKNNMEKSKINITKLVISIYI